MMTPRKTMKGSLFRKKKKMADFLQETPIKTEVENTEKSRVRSENRAEHVDIFNIGSVNTAEHVEKSEEKLEKICTQDKKTREENAREVQTLIKTLSQNETVS